MTAAQTEKRIEEKTERRVVIRIAGDSGDGVQLTGTEFSRANALAGADIATFPDFPAEIRAPAGTLAGVSGFQLHFASDSIYTPGDAPDVLVAMNPAALKKNVGDLKPGGMLIANSATFTKQNLSKVGYDDSPLDDDVLLERHRVFPIDMAGQVERALDGSGLSTKEIARTKNFWALGLLYWLYNRDIGKQVDWINAKFSGPKKARFADANITAFKAGHAYGDTTEMFGETYRVEPAKMEPGTYRNIMGNQALATGLVAAAQLAELPLFLGSYPITPASDILHAMAKFRHYDVTTFQAEDEIAAMCSIIGAAYGGNLAVCSTSGPGLALKGEAMGLGHMFELPMVIVNVQRGGPSTGLPTKTEQSDLMQVLYGRNGEAPLPVIAARSPADCFAAAIDACRAALSSMSPVVLVSDGYIANGAEPWRLPKIEDLEPIDVNFRTDAEGYQVYARDEKTLARDWVLPGTPGLEHRIGGLEKDALSGEVSYDPQNHEVMCRTRAEKVQRLADRIGPAEVEGPEEGDLLVVGWGGTYGTLRQATEKARAEGKRVAHLHLRWLNPFQKNVEDILKSYKNVLVCELNLGQLWQVLRSEYLVDAKRYNKMQGLPFTVAEIEAAIDDALS